MKRNTVKSCETHKTLIWIFGDTTQSYIAVSWTSKWQRNVKFSRRSSPGTMKDTFDLPPPVATKLWAEPGCPLVTLFQVWRGSFRETAHSAQAAAASHASFIVSCRNISLAALPLCNVDYFSPLATPLALLLQPPRGGTHYLNRGFVSGLTVWTRSIFQVFCALSANYRRRRGGFLSGFSLRLLLVLFNSVKHRERRREEKRVVSLFVLHLGGEYEPCPGRQLLQKQNGQMLQTQKSCKRETTEKLAKQATCNV